MKIAGIICEYNPIHSGHEHHMSETRRLLGDDCVIICVMSGNFVQRGDAAIFRKHARAHAAVLCGADLVLELPLPWAISSAERFAYGGTSLLDALGVCTHISFGSESGDIAVLSGTARIAASDEASALTVQKLKSGISYASARAAAVSELGGASSVLNNPNDTLAIEYIKALMRLDSKIEPLAVKRVGAVHDGKECDGHASASHLRSLLFRGGDAWPHIPENAASILKTEAAAGRGPVSIQALELPIMARLRTMTDSEFEALPDASEGLERRFAECSRSKSDLESVLSSAKTKRYAYSRLRRMALSAYLGISASDSDGTPPYARVLAANAAGRRILSAISKSGSIPVLTKPAAVRKLDERSIYIFEKEVRATDLYTLAYEKKSERYGGQEWKISPVMV